MKRITAAITDELWLKITEISKKDRRSFSQTVEMLLEYAIKEKNRKR